MSSNEPVAPATPQEPTEVVPSPPEPQAPPADAPPSTPAEAVNEPEAPSGETQDDKPQKVSRRDRRIESLIARAVAAETRAELLEKQLKPADDSPDTTERPVPPDPSKFDLRTLDGTNAYTRALSEHSEALADWKVSRALEEYSAQQTRQTAGEQRDVAWARQVQAMTGKHPDFSEVAMDTTLPVSQDTAEVLKEWNRGAEVLYWLGQNRAEAERLFPLKGTDLHRALGAIETRLDAVATPPPATDEPPAPPVTTAAPPPPKTVGTGTASKTKDPNKMSTEEYIRWREAERAKKRR